MLIIKRPGNADLFWCAECGDRTPMLAPDEAATLKAVSVRINMIFKNRLLFPVVSLTILAVLPSYSSSLPSISFGPPGGAPGLSQIDNGRPGASIAPSAKTRRAPKAAQTCTPPPPGMAAWYPGDGNADDIIGANNGTLSGDVSFTAGEVDQAFTFGGVDGEVVIPHTSALDFGPTDSFTVDAWLKPGPSVLGTQRAAVSLTSFTVTVNDTQAPSITCPANITVVSGTSSGTTVVTYPPVSFSDNCSFAEGCSPPSGSAFPAGTTTVTCSAHDKSFNTSQCSFTVTVLMFDARLQDDSDGCNDTVLFNTATGDYICRPLFVKGA